MEEHIRKLKIIESKFKYLMSASKEMFFFVDTHGCITEMNTFGLEILGYGPQEDVCLSLKQIFYEPKRLDSCLQCLELKGCIADMEVEFVKKDGTLAYVLLSATALVDDDGDVIGFEAVAQDTGQLKSILEQMSVSEKMASVGQIAAGVAHEINTPLGIILGYTQLMLDDCSPQSEEYENLKIIERQTRTSKKIVADLLKFSRQSGNLKEPIDINEIVSDAVAVTGHNLSLSRIEASLALEPDLPQVLGDAEKLRQVIVNLINNAQYAMEKQGKGELFLSTSFCEEDAEVIIRVRDTGCGISDFVQAKIFDPFFTTKPAGKGTGLGLSVSNRIIQEHLGKMEVESPVKNKEGRFFSGTEFRIFLPVTGGVTSVVPR